MLKKLLTIPDESGFWEHPKRTEADAEADQRCIREQLDPEAERLIATIPKDHIQVRVTDIYDSLKGSYSEYDVDGIDISWEDVEIAGCATATRHGALDPFKSRTIAHISRARLAELKEKQIGGNND